MVKSSSTVQLVDQKQAVVWLEKRYKHQRSVSPAHVDALAKAMSDGTFSPVSIIMFSVLGEEMHLINGQQTLRAIVKSGQAQTLPVMFYEVSNPEEEAKLYFHIDRQRKRNFGDSVRATGLCDESSLSPTMVKQTAAALRFIKGNFGTKRSYSDSVSFDELIEWVPQWAWETRALYNAISPCSGEDRNMIVSVAVFSVALVTMRYQPEKAREFWKQVAQDDGLEREDPRKALRNWIIYARGTDRRMARKIPSYEAARACATAWNAWFSGKKLKSLAYVTRSGKLAPVKILGTSYSGVQGEDFLPIYPSPNLEQARLLEETSLSPSFPA